MQLNVGVWSQKIWSWKRQFCLRHPLTMREGKCRKQHFLMNLTMPRRYFQPTGRARVWPIRAAHVISPTSNTPSITRFQPSFSYTTHSGYGLPIEKVRNTRVANVSIQFSRERWKR